MQIDKCEEQCENARSSICEILEPRSNVTLESFLQRERDVEHRRSTDEGMQIEQSDEQSQKASHSISESVDPASNVTLERASHS
jgi:hypothetical protein